MFSPLELLKIHWVTPTNWTQMDVTLKPAFKYILFFLVWRKNTYLIDSYESCQQESTYKSLQDRCNSKQPRILNWPQHLPIRNSYSRMPYNFLALDSSILKSPPMIPKNDRIRFSKCKITSKQESIKNVGRGGRAGGFQSLDLWFSRRREGVDEEGACRLRSSNLWFHFCLIDGVVRTPMDAPSRIRLHGRALSPDQWRTQDQNSWGAKKPRYKIKQDGKNYSYIKFKFHIYQYNIQVQRSEANIQLSSSWPNQVVRTLSNIDLLEGWDTEKEAGSDDVSS